MMPVMMVMVVMPMNDNNHLRLRHIRNCKAEE